MWFSRRFSSRFSRRFSSANFTRIGHTPGVGAATFAGGWPDYPPPPSPLSLCIHTHVYTYVNTKYVYLIDEGPDGVSCPGFATPLPSEYGTHKTALSFRSLKYFELLKFFELFLLGWLAPAGVNHGVLTRQGHTLALTVLHVPDSLESGGERETLQVDTPALWGYNPVEDARTIPTRVG